MNQRSPRSLIYIAISQILICVLELLGNKIADLIKIPTPWLIISVILILAAIIGLEFYKERTVKLITQKTKKRKTSQLTKNTVRLGMAYLAYYPLALLLAGGAIFLAYKMESKVINLPWWIIVIPIVSTLLFYPFYAAKGQSSPRALEYIRAGRILALLYSGLGISSFFFPVDVFSSPIVLILYAIISEFVNFGLNVTYVLFLVEVVFIPWYKKLPE